NFTVRVWDVATAELQSTLEGHSGAFTSVAFSPDGRTIASGSSDRTVRLWDVADRRVRATLRGHGEEITFVAFAPNDGKTLASGSYDHSVKLWDLSGGSEQARLKTTLIGHLDSVHAVAFS